MSRKPNKTKDLQETIEKYKFNGIGLTTTEKRRGGKIFRDYCNVYHIDKLSDLELLNELVWREIIQQRYKKKIGDLSKTKRSKRGEKNKISTEIVPKRLVDELNDNLKNIVDLKDKLGLMQGEEGNSVYDYIEDLKERFRKYREENIEEFMISCPFCGEEIVLNLRTDKYKASNLRLFKNKILCNKELWLLYKKEGKITKKDMAKVLNVSTDYIDWLDSHIYKEDKKQLS